MAATPTRNSGFRVLCGQAALAAATLIVATGCGSPEMEYPAAGLQGTVTLDGVPVETGRVTFMPNSGTAGVPVSAEIEGGAYTAQNVPQGNVIVTFAMTKATGNMIVEGDREPYPEIVSIVPEAYEQGIAIEVSPSAEVQDFALSSTGARP